MEFVDWGHGVVFGIPPITFFFFADGYFYVKTDFIDAIVYFGL
jgi:hypothetical protein